MAVTRPNQIVPLVLRSVYARRAVLTTAFVVAGIGLTVACRPVAAQDVAKDVPPEHWAYKAVEDLASKGLIKGYPPDGNFLGKRTLTRYEMATIIERVLARMDDLLANQKPGVSQADFDALKSSVGEIRALVDDFKTQLTVIGADMDKVKADLDALKGAVGDLTNRVNGFDDRLNGISKKVDDTAIVADQAIASIKELRDATNAALAKKVDVGVGKLRVSGLLQIWYGTAFGDTLGGNINPATGKQNNYGPVPQGRNYGGGVGDTFRVRRGEIFLIGSVTPTVDYRAMFDIAKTGSGGDNSILQELRIGYQFARHWRFEVGQQKTGLSEEGTRSDAELLTVARSIMNEDLPITAGRVGNAYSPGAALRYQSKPFTGFVGIWNDLGALPSGVDNNRLKFLDGALYFNVIRRITFGVWAGTNVGHEQAEEKREREGVTFLYQSGPHFFEAEGAYGRDYAAGAPGPGLSGTVSRGAYFLYAHTLSRKWQLVGRYDNWDPSTQGGNIGPSTTESGVMIVPLNHKLREYTLGVNYYIHSNNAKIQVNYIREDTEDNGANFFGKQRTLLLSNFQIAF